MEKELLKLWKEYYHYKYMTSGIFKTIFFNCGISFEDFMRWLDSRN